MSGHSVLQLLCSSVQKALYEEEEQVKTLSQKVRSLEKANSHLRDKVKSLKRLLRQAKSETKEKKQHLKELLHKPKPAKVSRESHLQQDTTQEQSKPPKKVVSRKPKS